MKVPSFERAPTVAVSSSRRRSIVLPRQMALQVAIQSQQIVEFSYS